MAIHGGFFSKMILFLVGFIALISFPVEAAVKKYQFDVSQIRNAHFISILIIL